MKDIKGKVVVITGGAMGLGKLMAGHFAADGAKLALVDLNQTALEQTATEFREQGTEAFGYVCDVSDRQAVYKMAEKVRADLGSADVLVNNAGIAKAGSFLEIDDEDHQKVMDVNLMAHFWTTRAFLPDMVEKGAGHLLVIASAAGLAAMPKISSYVASKFGAVGLAESLRMEFENQGLNIPVTIVCPSLISTGMFEGSKPSFMAPWLTPEKITRIIYKHFKKNKAYVLAPFTVKAMPFSKAVLPASMFDRIFKFLGLFTAFDEYKGRT